MVKRSFVFLVSTCLLLIFNLLMLIGCKKYGGTNIIISSDSGGCGGSWSSGGCGGGGQGNIIMTKGDKKGKGDKIIITTGGGGGNCCGGWKPHHHHHHHPPPPHHHHSWKPMIVPIKAPSYHSHWPLTNWPHTSSWAHHTLDHNSHHHHHHPQPHHSHHHTQHLHQSPSVFHSLLNWDKQESLLSPGWDKHEGGDSLLSRNLWEGGKQSHLRGDHHELLPVTPSLNHHEHSPWNEWLGSSVSPSWLKKNYFGSLDELSEDSWNEIWR